MSKEEIERSHQDIREWVEDVINDKYGMFAYNMLWSLMHGFKGMKDEIDIYTKKRKKQIKKNRERLGLPSKY